MNESVIRALEAITRRINISTGLVYPNDKECTVELLTFLKNKGINLEPNRIYDWCIENGWKDRHAKDLKEVVEKINSGHRYRFKKCWNDNFLNSL